MPKRKKSSQRPKRKKTSPAKPSAIEERFTDLDKHAETAFSCSKAKLTHGHDLLRVQSVPHLRQGYQSCYGGEV